MQDPFPGWAGLLKVPGSLQLGLIFKKNGKIQYRIQVAHAVETNVRGEEAGKMEF